MIGIANEPLKIEYIDTHCHVDLFQDPNKIVKHANQLKTAVIAVTNIPSVFPHMMVFANNQTYTYPALGLHPELVEERGSEISLMWDLFDETRFIGEVGLDYTTPHQTIRSKQREIFKSILERCADSGDKVLTIHSRRAAHDVVSAIGENFPGTIILHWYSGSKNTLEQAVANGYYFSVNLAMTRSKKGKEIISMIPKERILTETDGPFIKNGNRACDPSDIQTTVGVLSQLLNESENETKKRLVNNFVCCYSKK